MAQHIPVQLGQTGEYVNLAARHFFSLSKIINIWGTPVVQRILYWERFDWNLHSWKKTKTKDLLCSAIVLELKTSSLRIFQVMLGHLSKKGQIFLILSLPEEMKSVKREIKWFD